jgi:hypothetical protein
MIPRTLPIPMYMPASLRDSWFRFEVPRGGGPRNNPGAGSVRQAFGSAERVSIDQEEPGVPLVKDFISVARATASA